MKNLFCTLIIGFAIYPLLAKAMDPSDNSCNKITGVWDAAGNIVIDSPTPGATCSYVGTATVKNPKKSINFSADVVLTLVSGDCPASANGTLSGTCTNGDVKLTGSFPTGVNYDIAGTVPKKGNKMPITGTVSYKLGDSTVVTAHLDNAVLTKQ